MADESWTLEAPVTDDPVKYMKQYFMNIKREISILDTEHKHAKHNSSVDRMASKLCSMLILVPIIAAVSAIKYAVPDSATGEGIAILTLIARLGAFNSLFASVGNINSSWANNSSTSEG